MSLIDSLKAFLQLNIKTKSEINRDKSLAYINGIIWNAYDTYISVIFNKKLILKSNSKKYNTKEILKFLNGKGLNKKLFSEILYDLWFGGGGGLTVLKDRQIKFIPDYLPVQYNFSNDWDFVKNRVIKYKTDGSIFYKDKLIEGPYFEIRKAFDKFGNKYSVIDRCFVIIRTYAEISRYLYDKSAKNFQREMFYSISSDTLLKINEEDKEADISRKTEHNQKVFNNIKERLTVLFKSISNVPRIIQSAITPVFVDTEISLSDLSKAKESIIKEIAIICNVPASSLGISNSANKAQSEQDRDNLASQAINYTNIFVDTANYWLSQFYPDLVDDLTFSWEENETDESLQIREQNLEALNIFLTNGPALTALGINVDKKKAIELANSVSIEGLFIEETNTNTTDIGFRLSDERDATLKNWTYNPKKTRSVQLSDLDTSKLKTVSIDRYDENKDVIEYKGFINDKITKYITDLYNFNQRADNLKLSDFIQEDLFSAYLEKLANEAVKNYNETNQTNIEIQNWIEKESQRLTDLTYLGDQKDYKGIENTIKTEISNGRSLKDTIKSTLTSVQNVLYTGLFNSTVDEVAVKDGAKYIGTVAKNDDLVRKLHLENSEIIQKIGAVFAYWLEKNCRCNRFYGSLEDLIEAGFINKFNY